MPDVSKLFPMAATQPMSDRRRIQRFVNAWAAASKGAFPSWRELRQIDLGSDWNWVYVVDLAQSQGYPHFDFLGPRLSELAEIYLAGGGDWAVSVLDRAADDINAAVTDQGPHMCEDTLVLEDGAAVLVRCVTAPLSEDGETISQVVGIVSGRLEEISDAGFSDHNEDSVDLDGSAGD
ncbi:MAG: hypothetical protein AAFX08_10865 [Pseudomonadota bacterium]